MVDEIEAGPRVTLGDGIHRLAGVSAGSLTEFCGRHGIRALSLFGSYARGEETPGGDLDILVEFRPDRTPDLLAMVAMEMELNELTGRRVDFRTREEISRYARDRVLAEARPIIVC